MHPPSDSRTIRLGISTCPNDTFAFHGLLTGRVDRRGLTFDLQLLDIQQLNERLASGTLDVAKASFYAALQLGDLVVALPSGSAIGFGVGPLLLSWREISLGELKAESARRPIGIACPGATTTATFLCRSMLPFPAEMQQIPFSEIMPRLKSRAADLGACIHEGRFVWQEQGLFVVADLGALWEDATGQPLPLGGLFARADLPIEIARRVQEVIRDSIEYGRRHRGETIETMRRYAQEFDDDVLLAHVDLYVNDWTVDLGSVGRAALASMHDVAISRGLLPRNHSRLQVLDA